MRKVMTKVLTDSLRLEHLSKQRMAQRNVDHVHGTAADTEERSNAYGTLPV